MDIIGACQQCGKAQNLTVEQLIPFIDIVDGFERLNATSDFMVGVSENEKWRLYFQQTQVALLKMVVSSYSF